LPEGQFNASIHGRKGRFDCLSVSNREARGLEIPKFSCGFGGVLPVPGKYRRKWKVELKNASRDHTHLRREGVSGD